MTRSDLIVAFAAGFGLACLVAIIAMEWWDRREWWEDYSVEWREPPTVYDQAEDEWQEFLRDTGLVGR